MENKNDDIFTNEFINEVLSKEDVELKDKVEQIIAQHNASVRGLVSKKEELLGNEVKLKDKLKSFETEKSELLNKATELENQLKQNSPEETKKYLESQMAIKEKEWLTEKEKIVAERDKFRTSHLERLKNDAISEGIKDINFIDGLKDGFVARVLMMNNFEPKEIDGQTVFVDKNMKEIKDVMHDFALSNEGKAFIKCPFSGGGATGSGGNVDFDKTKQVSSQQLDNMSEEQIMEFALKGGQVV